jgi:hypothetical protein
MVKMKNFSQMKIEVKVKDAMSNGNDFSLNFYGCNAPVKCIRALIEKYDISMGEIYLPLENIIPPLSEPGKSSHKNSVPMKEG